MIEFLRALKLGAVNLFGVAIPGFMLLFFSVLGAIAPAIVLCMGLFHTTLPFEILENYKLPTTVVVVIFSYVGGYILRLSTPDELDKKSAQVVLETMDEDEKSCWPYTGNPTDKFPYEHFWLYLEQRGLNEVRRQVTWGKPLPGLSGPQFGKRSKTAIHQMKLDVLVNCRDLFAEIESYEAHIRLMSGTWFAIKATWLVVLVGAISTMAGIFWFSRPALTPMPFDPRSWLLVLLISNVALLGAMSWANRSIERLFHYRRVNELVWIVMAANAVRTKRAATVASE